MKYTVAKSRTDTIVRYDIIPKKRGRTASEILSSFKIVKIGNCTKHRPPRYLEHVTSLPKR